MQSAYFEQEIIPKSTSYAKWSLGLNITETASTSTSITISISVYMIRDNTPGDKKATGYHFDNGNSLAISVGGEQIYYDANAAHLQIDGGVASKTLIKTVTHTDTKASDGSYTKTISALHSSKPNHRVLNGMVQYLDHLKVQLSQRQIHTYM